MRIELVGGLGIGKSTLCNALDKIGFHSIYETLATNPFLADCFADPAGFRFPSQMWFVLSKFHEIRKFERLDRINVLDQSVLNVKAYTNLLFRGEDPQAHAIISQCFAYLEAQLGAPDLLINLTCSPQEQLRRIRNRNRPHEAQVGLTYITDLNREIEKLVEVAKKDNLRVLEINTEEVYLPDNFAFAEELARKIAHIAGVNLSDVIDPSFPRQYALAE